MSQTLILAGLILIVVGIVLGLLSLGGNARKASQPPAPTGERKTRGGGVIIIGPFPIVFGSDPQTVKIILVLAIILVILLIVLFLLGRIV